MADEKEMSALELLEEIGNNMSPEKATRAKILIPKLRDKIIADGDSAAANIEGLVKRDEEIMELHNRLGDRKVSDCCGEEIYCGNCHDKKLCTGRCRCENYTQNCLKCKNPCGYRFDDCDHKWVFDAVNSQELFIPKGEREKTNLFDQCLIRERIDTKECMDEDKMTMLVHCEKCHHWKEINWTEYSLV